MQKKRAFSLFFSFLLIASVVTLSLISPVNGDIQNGNYYYMYPSNDVVVSDSGSSNAYFGNLPASGSHFVLSADQAMGMKFVSGPNAYLITGFGFYASSTSGSTVYTKVFVTDMSGNMLGIKTVAVRESKVYNISFTSPGLAIQPNTPYLLYIITANNIYLNYAGTNASLYNPSISYDYSHLTNPFPSAPWSSHYNFAMCAYTDSSDELLTVSKNSDAQGVTLMNFDLSGYTSDDIVSARLYLSTSSIPGTTAGIINIKQQLSPWDDSNVTWSTVNLGSSIASYTDSGNLVGWTYYQIADVTYFVQSQIDSEQTLIQLALTSSTNNFCSIWQSSTAPNQPVLLLQLSPPTFSDVASYGQETYQQCKLSAYVQDGYNLGQYKIQQNSSGTMETAIGDFTSNPQWLNTTITLPYAETNGTVTVQWRYGASTLPFLDGGTSESDVWTYTDWQNISVIVIDSPPTPTPTPTPAPATLDLTIGSPSDGTTYTSPDIPVVCYVTTDGTNLQTTYNVQFTNGTWLFAENQTYTTPTTMTISTNDTDITFYAQSTVTEGVSAQAQTVFSTSLTYAPNPTPQPTVTPTPTPTPVVIPFDPDAPPAYTTPTPIPPIIIPGDNGNTQTTHNPTATPTPQSTDLLSQITQAFSNPIILGLTIALVIAATYTITKRRK